MSAAADRALKFRWLLPGVFIAVFAWVFYSERIAPLQARERMTRHRLQEWQGKVAAERQAIEGIRAMEQRAAAARSALDRWRQERPAASAMVWFPDRMKRHFQRFGIAEPVTRLNTAKTEPELPRFQRSYWAVDLPMQDKPGEIGKVLLAVAGLAQAEPHARVLDFAIRQDAADTSQRVATINVSTLARE